MSFESLAEGG